MAGEPQTPFLRRLIGGIPAEAFGDLSDRQLVERYLSGGGSAAFEAIVRRHGPMVYRVCWRTLQKGEDAEDAFQATFFLLARKIRAVRNRDSLAAWLHGVAYRIAIKARSLSTARLRHERQAAAIPAVPPVDISGGEIRVVLDVEMDRLPEKWRLPLILCYLEGRTQDEAAAQLGWSKSTIRRRLDDARTALAQRLGRQGFGPATLFAALLCDSAATARPCAQLIGPAVGAATAPVVPVRLAALIEGVSRSMTTTKLLLTSAALLVLTAIGAGGTLLNSDDPAPPSVVAATGTSQIPEKGTEPPKPAAAAAVPAAESILLNGGFEEGDTAPEHWSEGAEIDGVKYIWDKKTGQKGKASLCLHKTAQRYFPIAQWYQVVDRKGDRPALRVTAQVKAAKVTKAILDVSFLDGDGDAIGHKWASYIGAKEAKDPPVSHSWKEYTGRVEIPKEAKKIQVSLQIYGPGQVWFDEVRAEYAE